MAEVEGCSVAATRSWRNRRGLPYNRCYSLDKRCANFNLYDRPIWERKIVRRFMSDLLRLCEKVGRTPNSEGIGKAMEIWREKGGVA